MWGAYGKDVVVAQLALVLERRGGGGGACGEGNSNQSIKRGLVRAVPALRTFGQVLDGFPHASVERSGVSRTLEGQAALPVLHLPVVKRGICDGVHEVLPQRAVQNHLLALHR